MTKSSRGLRDRSADSVLRLPKWLENYAYRIEIQPWIFVLTIVISLCIVLLVTNWQIRQASRNNPIDTLKTE